MYGLSRHAGPGVSAIRSRIFCLVLVSHVERDDMPARKVSRCAGERYSVEIGDRFRLEYVARDRRPTR